MGAPRKRPPKDAADTILNLAKEGYNKEGIARNLKVAKNTFDKWLKEYPALQDALDEGRAKEHNKLYNALFLQATDGKNAAAAMFLLKTRHGYRENGPSEGDTGPKVNLTVNIPAPLNQDQYKQLVRVNQKTLEIEHE